jgi:leucyl-tRNA synthetase
VTADSNEKRGDGPAYPAYDAQAIETKWQAVWEREGLYKTDEDPGKPKKYVLEMFPYPSGDLHMGHARNYSIGDAMARQARMRGFDVLHPMGFDAFGLPAENAAIKHNTQAKRWTYENMDNAVATMKRMGFSYDYDRMVKTCDPDYYRWGQWIFLKMWERGLVYRDKSPVNWCPTCKTVLANEQVTEGRCWRCGSIPEKRDLDQWYLKITDYAQELLDDLDKLEGWPERVKQMQRNWIGRSEGAEVVFALAEKDGTTPSDTTFTVFTTRPDTLFGCSFFLLSPEHPMVGGLVAGTEYEEGVKALQAEAAKATNVERQGSEREKHGAPTGRFAINPVNGRRPCPSGSPTTCSWTTAPAPSWPFPAATSATSTSPASTACPSPRSSPRGTILSTPASRTSPSSSSPTSTGTARWPTRASSCSRGSSPALSAASTRLRSTPWSPGWRSAGRVARR